MPLTNIVKTTEDGSKTLYSSRFGEHYHSTFGALNESRHIFIDSGYNFADVNPVSILEIGFGTGLNAWLTMLEADRQKRSTYYEALELYPVDLQTASELSKDVQLMQLHTAAWGETIDISPYFKLHKRQVDLTETSFTYKFDVVYFDAFSPAVQPEMWTLSIFEKIYEAMNPQAVLTTYCAKGEVRRIMQRAGLVVERLPGPIGKREILRGKKISY